MEQNKNHSINLTNREEMTLLGINDVDSFNEEEIIAFSDYGDLSIKGTMLHVEELDLPSGAMKVTGKITAIIYSEKRSDTSLFSRLFHG